jgi:pimeloyl-ACP methyl ester carboxylesterase
LKRYNVPRSYYHEASAQSTPAERLASLHKREHGVVLRRLLALNPSTPSQTLRQLAYPRDNKTWRHLAQNPSSPIEVLRQVGVIFPDGLWKNPVLPLLFLEQPALLEDRGLYRRLLLAPNAPSEFLEVAAQHADASIRWAAAKNPSTPSEALDALSLDEDKGVRDAAAQHPCTMLAPNMLWVQQIKAHQALSPEDKARLSQGNTYLRTLLAAHPATTQAELRYLAKDQSKKVVRAVFNRADIPRELLAYSADLPDWRMALIAAHPETSSETLREIYRAQPSKDSINPSLNALWKNPNTPEEIMYEVIKYVDAAEISANQKLSQETLLRLIQSPNLKTRLEAFRNPNISRWVKSLLSRIGYNAYDGELKPVPPITSHEELGMLYLLRTTLADLLEKIAWISQINYHEITLRSARSLLHHPLAELRLAAAKEPTIPKEELDAMYQIGATQDLSGIIKDPLPAEEWLIKRLSRGGYFARWLVAQHPATDAKVLGRLVYAESPIAALALCHINTSEETLLRVAQQKNKPLHLAMLRRAKLPESVLWWLVSSEHAEVRQGAARRPESEEISEHLRAAGAAESLVGFKEATRECAVEVLERLAGLGLYGQQLAARHPKTPSIYLNQFAASLRPSLRVLAARNPSTPTKTLRLLQKLGASHDLSEIETADPHTEKERTETRALGKFGELLVNLSESH